MTAVFGMTPTTFIPPFNTGDSNTLKALHALGFTLYSTSPDDFGVKEANLQNITVQGLTFGLGWSDDPTGLAHSESDRADRRSARRCSAWRQHCGLLSLLDLQQARRLARSTNIFLFKQYIEHLKSRGDVLFTTLGGQQLLTPSSAPTVCSQDGNSLEIFAQGVDRALWHKRWNSTIGWSAWESLGGC